MTDARLAAVAEARAAALAVLLHNAHGPYDDLPREAGWGYPEPYTRDLMVAAFGILATGHPALLTALERVLRALAAHQTPHGHIPGLAHDPTDLGASDTTPLFLLGLGLFRQVTGDTTFLAEAAARALTWLEYQSPTDEILVAQQPTSDWRDEQWVLGYGLYVNTLVYAALRLFDRQEQARRLRTQLHHPAGTPDRWPTERGAGLVLPGRPYYALWSYKIYHSARCDVLGNSLAILFALASPERARALIDWVEQRCSELRAQGDLVGDLPPCLLPYIQPDDPEWRPRYAAYNRPGEYHNGGVWPFVAGFYVAALVKAGYHDLAAQKLAALTALVRPARHAAVPFGFNEWIRAQDGMPAGEDWQTWSAALYLYAAAAVEQQQPPFFAAALVP
jgi:hypothetical protein